MEFDELLEQIKAGEYDPRVSGDVVEFYCRREDHGINPEPRRADDAVETGSKNPTYGHRLSDAETAFVDRPTVRRAMGAGWLLANPVPTAIRTHDGDVYPVTDTTYDHVSNYGKRRRLERFGVEDPVWEIDTKWIVDVPEGYSVLYAHPFNYDREAFTTLPGILDADQFPAWFTVPVALHVDHGNIQFGEPLAQVVPFRRADAPVDAAVEVVEGDPVASGGGAGEVDLGSGEADPEPAGADDGPSEAD